MQVRLPLNQCGFRSAQFLKSRLKESFPFKLIALGPGQFGGSVLEFLLLRGECGSLLLQLRVTDFQLMPSPLRLLAILALARRLVDLRLYGAQDPLHVDAPALQFRQRQFRLGDLLFLAS